MCVTMIDPNHRLVTTCEFAGISAVRCSFSAGSKGHNKDIKTRMITTTRLKKPTVISHTNKIKKLFSYTKASLKKPTVMCVLMTQ